MEEERDKKETNFVRVRYFVVSCQIKVSVLSDRGRRLDYLPLGGCRATHVKRQ